LAVISLAADTRFIEVEVQAPNRDWRFDGMLRRFRCGFLVVGGIGMMNIMLVPSV
jgi:hypothetical protein